MPEVSLILAGAVSLGSVEAGVLDEILYVLDRLNQRRSGDDPYVIDSLGGASAGSMTAALVAQAVRRGFEKRHLLLTWGDGMLLEVVGVVADVRQRDVQSAGHHTSPPSRRPRSLSTDAVIHGPLELPASSGRTGRPGAVEPRSPGTALARPGIP